MENPTKRVTSNQEGESFDVDKEPRRIQQKLRELHASLLDKAKQIPRALCFASAVSAMDASPAMAVEIPSDTSVEDGYSLLEYASDNEKFETSATLITIFNTDGVEVARRWFSKEGSARQIVTSANDREMVLGFINDLINEGILLEGFKVSINMIHTHPLNAAQEDSSGSNVERQMMPPSPGVDDSLLAYFRTLIEIEDKLGKNNINIVLYKTVVGPYGYWKWQPIQDNKYVKIQEGWYREVSHFENRVEPKIANALMLFSVNDLKEFLESIKTDIDKYGSYFKEREYRYGQEMASMETIMDSWFNLTIRNEELLYSAFETPELKRSIASLIAQAISLPMSVSAITPETLKMLNIENPDMDSLLRVLEEKRSLDNDRLNDLYYLIKQSWNILRIRTTNLNTEDIQLLINGEYKEDEELQKIYDMYIKALKISGIDMQFSIRK